MRRKHGVDQAGIARRPAVGLDKAHGQIDGGVIGHIEQKDLRRAEQQGGLDPRRVGRKTALEHRPKQMPQRSESSQDRRHQPPRQRAVAVLKAGKVRMRMRAVELLVERAPPPQHAFQYLGGDAAGGEACYRRRVMRRHRYSLRTKRPRGRGRYETVNPKARPGSKARAGPRDRRPRITRDSRP